MRKLFLFVLTVLIHSLLLGQEIAIGQWRVHLPYNNALTVVANSSNVFVGTNGGMFTYNKTDGSVERFSKINGLSDNDVKSLAYDKDRDQVVVGYKNGNLDVIKADGSIINLTDIKRKNITADKAIFNIYIKDKTAYLSTGFGIVVMDLAKLEILDTYIIGANATYRSITGVTQTTSRIYAATTSGIYSAAINSPNLADYNYWKLDTTISAGYYSGIVCAGNNVFTCLKSPNMADKDTLLLLKNNGWSVITDNYYDVYNLKVFDNRVYKFMYGGVTVFDSEGVITGGVGGYTQDNLPRDIFPEPSYIWIADNAKGLVKQTSGGFEFIVPNGPPNITSGRFAYANKMMYTAGGAVTDGWGNTYNGSGVYIFKDGEWTYKNNANTQKWDGAYDLINLSIDPLQTAGTHYFVGTWGKGLLEFNADTIVTTHKGGSSKIKKEEVNNVSWYGIGGVTHDNSGNLWITNAATKRGLVVYTADKVWKDYQCYDESGAPTPADKGAYADVVVDQNGTKWFVNRGRGIHAYNENGTTDDESDDKYRTLTQTVGNGSLHTLGLNCIAVDQNNDIWLGTDQGISVFSNASAVFNEGAFTAQQIKIDINGVVGYLLETENVTAIAVDDANRKWIGTTSAGLFLVSEDGTKQLQHFTTDNSPILSNNIYCLGINRSNGELFIGTENGMISYKSDATEPTENYQDVYAYPNPVKPDYTGVIAIKNLVQNADVKITDTQGNLVYQTKALGGQAIWNGKNFNGEKVATGVYMVFSASTDGTNTNVTKILFIK